MIIKRYHADIYEGDASVYISDAPCFDDDCQLGSQEHVHVFTDAELRARDERMIRATAVWADVHDDSDVLERIDDGDPNEAYDYIIAAAEAET